MHGTGDEARAIEHSLGRGPGVEPVLAAGDEDRDVSCGDQGSEIRVGVSVISDVIRIGGPVNSEISEAGPADGPPHENAEHPDGGREIQECCASQLPQGRVRKLSAQDDTVTKKKRGGVRRHLRQGENKPP